jgi:hypothetical protein
VKRVALRGAVAAMLSLVGTAVHAQPAAATRPGAVWSLTYLKANPGSVESLAEAIRRNWFALDARAVQGGDLVGYQLLRGTPADTTWDLLEITMYADSAQHARVDSVYRVRYRPTHTPVLVQSKRWQELGRIVRTATTRWVDGGPQPPSR